MSLRMFQDPVYKMPYNRLYQIFLVHTSKVLLKEIDERNIFL